MYAGDFNHTLDPYYVVAQLENTLRFQRASLLRCLDGMTDTVAIDAINASIARVDSLLQTIAEPIRCAS